MRAIDAPAEWGNPPAWRERLYDGLTLLLLMWPATGGMWLLGSTRVWGYAPGLVFTLCGSMLVFLRPVFLRGTPRWRLPAGGWAWVAVTAVVVLNMRWAAVPLPARWGALKWIALLAAGWSWTQMAGAPGRWRWLLFILLLSVTLESLYALIQEVNGSTQVLWAPRQSQYGDRASGTYLCPNHFANVLAMLFPLATVLVFLPSAGLPLRLMALYFLAVSTPALYWSLSRSGWGGMLGGLLVTGLLLAWRRSRAWFGILLLVLPLLMAFSGWVAWKTLPGVQMRVQQVLDLKAGAAGVRIPMWRDMPEMIRAHPLAGHGGGSFVWTYPPYQKHIDQHLTWDYLHNEYLQMQVEYGAVGFGLLMIALAWSGLGTMAAVMKTRGRASAALLAAAAGGLAASLIQALFDFNFHIFPNPHVLLWTGGVAWGVWFMEEGGAEPSTGWHRRVRPAAAVAGAVACGWAAWQALTGGISYAWNLKAEMARARMEWEAAESWYAKAITWDDWNWQPHLGWGHLKAAQATWYRHPDLELEQAGKERLAQEAAGHFQQALARNSCDMAAVFGLARARNALGDSEAALELLRRAAAYQHKHVFYREQVGIQLVRMKRDREALEVFRKNLADGVGRDVSRLNIRLLERRLAKEAVPASAAP